MKALNVVGIAVLISAIVLTVVFVFAVNVPADVRYNQRFGSHVTMAYDAASLEGMRDEVTYIWTKMNETFAGKDYATTYNSPWAWDQIYENSLLAQNRYFGQLISRIDYNIQLRDRMRVNATNPFYIEDWYAESLTKQELK